MTEFQWLDSAEQQAWRRYLRAVATLAEALNHDLIEEAGISLNEYEVLSQLSETDGHTMRMSTLADGLVHSRSRLTHTVRRLESVDLVERTACEDDRRGVNCTLTEAGYNFLVKIAPIHVQSVRKHLVDKLGHEKMVQLGELCAVLAESDESDQSAESDETA
ncbi:MAG: MarR family winged helix-turn-helix transcriptional regulator [Ancrocorticia sp.]|uniref:MarR family winged helix-turn-helix transcriptional regulator n=1 Tax=Ancrocorticia sp. TaxID=2593684 RepID=UPI003F92B9E6